MTSVPPVGAVSGWPDQHDSFPWSGALARRWLRILSLALGAWLLSPLAGMAHVEGFSASIDSLALHLAHGTLLDYDRQYPFNLDYFVATRAGVIVALAALHRLLPDGGEWAFRAVMLVGFVGIVGGSVVLIRRWTGLGVGFAVGALLLMPGVTESAFFYNDNVISSGLGILALAILAARSNRGAAMRAVGAGLSIGAAIACRSDALLLTPALVGMLWMRRAGPRSVVFGTGWIVLGVGIVFAMLFAAFGLTVLDSLAAARRAVGLWSRGPSLKAHATMLLLFVGIPALLLAVPGLSVLARQRDRAIAVTVIGTLVLYDLAYLGKAWEVRSFLPLTPFFAALVCLGAQWLIRQPSIRWRAAFAVLLVVALLAPPMRIATHDGPREVVGRAWAPLLWAAWQRERHADQDGFDRFVHGLDESALVVTSNWNADRYLHLALQDAGFTPVPTTGPATCAELVETVARGSVVVRHLRLHVPFVSIYPAYLPLRYDAFVRDCGGPPTQVAYLASLATLDDAGLVDKSTKFSALHVSTLPFLPPVTTEPDGVAMLDAPALQRLRMHWRDEAQASVADDGATLPAFTPPTMRATATAFAPSLERLHAR